MKKLESMTSVQELSIEDMVNTNGGIIPIAIMLGIWAFEGGVCCTLLGIAASRSK